MSAHIEQQHKGTKALSKVLKENAVGKEEEDVIMAPTQEEDNLKTQLAFATIIDAVSYTHLTLPTN
eukprot:858380-Ditylum_brightwellii.AAC.1